MMFNWNGRTTWRRCVLAGSTALLLAAMPSFAEDDKDKTLDELLGLDESSQTEPKASDGVVPEEFKQPDAVEPVPQGKDAVDLLKDVVREMDEVTGHFEKDKDAGPIAQRKQEDIILKLEQLIAAAQQAGGS